MKLKNAKYPCYYDVDDVPVALYLEAGEIVGKSANGRPYPVGKVIVEGIRVTKEEYFKLAKKLYGLNLRN